MNSEISNKLRLLTLALIVLISLALRVSFLDTFPPALYSDEVSQGYNAYSLLRTGKDEYGTLLPISIRSFGDWKPPVQTYLMIPTIAFFGLNEYGIRLPSAVIGSVTVVFIYLLVIELFWIFKIKNWHSTKYSDTPQQNIALLAAALLAISPWHIHQSRSAMLIIPELFFLTVAFWSFLKGLKSPKWLLISSISFSLGIYSYYGMRLIVPLSIVFLIWYFRHELQFRTKYFMSASIVMIVMLLPLGIAFMKQPNVLLGRAKTVSIFHDKGVALTVWDLIAQDGSQTPSLLAQFLHNKPYHYTADVMRRFFQHFDGRFLFLVGDKHPPFQIPGMGILYISDLIFIILGIVFLLKNNRNILIFLVFWIFISIIPASLTFVTPAANRTFTMVVPFVIITAVGIINLTNFIQQSWKKIALTFIGALYLFQFAFFIHQYLVDLPKNHADMWHYGYKELYSYLGEIEDQYDTIAVSAKASVPYIFLLYYQKIDPDTVEKVINRNFISDEFGFEHVNSFGKYQFPRSFTWEKDGERLSKDSLLVITERETTNASTVEKKKIYYPDGKVAFKIYEIQ